ncbi:energy transducer TonB [Myroides odoratimimus]|uniref:energy transducer TonB n=1 Tax=Myroides odoratimimus TaxID=76832 RepID=UPI002DB8B414|nr:energy transducer TonB [Myroides odoratimimus]MEC4052564.1 energy transducer TonB [Myroides odoratimimus]
MKNIVLPILLLISLCSCQKNSQSTSSVLDQEPKKESAQTLKEVKKDKIYKTVDIKANYQGGMTVFKEQFLSGFEVPEIDPGVEDILVIVGFIVEKDGSLSDVRILRDPGYRAGRETIRVLKTMNKWIPASNQGKVVRSELVLPITIPVN